jgi:hypothetical protein
VTIIGDQALKALRLEAGPEIPPGAKSLGSTVISGERGPFGRRPSQPSPGIMLSEHVVGAHNERTKQCYKQYVRLPHSSGHSARLEAATYLPLVFHTKLPAEMLSHTAHQITKHRHPMFNVVHGCSSIPGHHASSGIRKSAPDHRARPRPRCHSGIRLAPMQEKSNLEVRANATTEFPYSSPRSPKRQPIRVQRLAVPNIPPCHSRKNSKQI